MVRYILRRVLHAVLIVLITVTVTFVVLHLAPGDPLSRYMSPGIDPASLDRVRSQLGLDQPLHIQFVRWFAGFVTGHFGMSTVHHRPVADMLRETLPRTLVLTGLALLVQVVIGGLVGMVSAARRGRLGDRALSTAAITLYAVPAFYLGYLLITVLSLKTGWFPASGMRSIAFAGATGWEAFVDRARHIVLPMLTLGVANAAWMARFTRGSVLDALGEDYVRTARAKGIGERVVLWRHAFRNALPPLLTMIGLSAPFLLGGAVVVERVFAWPGAGSLMVDAILGRDYPLVLAINAVGAVLVVAGNLLADMSVAFADPRTKIASLASDAENR